MNEDFSEIRALSLRVAEDHQRYQNARKRMMNAMVSLGDLADVDLRDLVNQSPKMITEEIVRRFSSSEDRAIRESAAIVRLFGRRMHWCK